MEELIRVLKVISFVLVILSIGWGVSHTIGKLRFLHDRYNSKEEIITHVRIISLLSIVIGMFLVMIIDIISASLF